MNILGGYGSDDSSSGDEKVAPSAAVKKPLVAGPAPPPKKVVDFSKLQGCLRRPLQLDPDAEKQTEEEAPLAKKAKNLQPYVPKSKSMLDHIPAPQKEPVSLKNKNNGHLAVPTGQQQTQLKAANQNGIPDSLLSAVKDDAESSDSDDGEDAGDGNLFNIGQAVDPTPKKKPQPAPQISGLPDVCAAPDAKLAAMSQPAPGPQPLPDLTEASDQQLASAPSIDEVPENLWNHPMFKKEEGKRQRTDGFTPSEAEIHLMKKAGAAGTFNEIAHDQMTNPDWYRDNQTHKGRMGIKGETVAFECSLYDAAKWQTTAHSNPTKTQKRKHQINWLAHDAMEKEAELLERAAEGKQNKAQTYLKYGW